MKYIYLVMVLFLLSCSNQDNEQDNLTGNQLLFTLFSGSEFGYEGTVAVQEMTDGTALIEIRLEGPVGESVFPAHLHYGSFDTPDAELAALLTPIDARTGVSLTELRFLADDTEMTYADLERFDGHIKVHLDDGANQDVVLAFGNIGSNMLKLDGEAAPCEGPN